jgi:hypothetical protein
MTPPPIALLLKTKGQPQFNRAVDRTVEAVFCVFQPSNLAQFQACFLLSAVRPAEGRKAICRMLIAVFFLKSNFRS